MRRIAQVKWIDTSGSSGWMGYEDARLLRPQHVVTTGQVLEDDGQCIVIAGSVATSADDRQSCDGVMCIPYSAVLEVRDLDERRKEADGG